MVVECLFKILYNTFMGKKILIVGGGPAGCSAGIFLKKAGFEVTLFEKGDANRVKVCGEGLTPESQHMLKKLGVLENVKSVCLEVPLITMFDPDGNPILLRNRCWTVKRSVLDKILRDELLSLGGEVLYSTSIKKVYINDTKAVVEDVNSEKYEGEVLILATGAETSLAGSLGLGSQKGNSMVLMRGYAENTIGCNSLEFYFNKELSHCYAWVFPLPNNLLNIGVDSPKELHSTDDIVDLMDRFRNILNKKYKGRLGDIGIYKKWIINSGLEKKKIFSDRALLCGENIHSTYSFSGEGIAPALKTGFYAASAIIEARGDYSRAGLSSYKEKIENGIGPTHKIYNIMYRILGTTVGFRIVSWFLRRSKRAKKLVEGVIDEEVPLKKGFLSAIWYSRKL